MTDTDQSQQTLTGANATPADARAVGLSFSSDADPGITRKLVRKTFTYSDPAGNLIRDEKELLRIAGLVIPSAWTNVWICPNPRGHLQVTGRDAKGRKQYRYLAKWRAHREVTKFGRLSEFGRMLPTIRAHVERDLHRPGIPREKVLATVIILLEQTGIRVGNDEYARSNSTYGLTTLTNSHVDVGSTSIRFQFTGKSGKEHELTLQDRRLARIVKRCQDLPGQRLFEFRDEAGEIHSINSTDVNTYLRELTDADFTAKDFRTWIGTVTAVSSLRHLPKPESAEMASRDILASVDTVAEVLGNTRAVARSSYIHPEVLAAYEDGRLQDLKPETCPDVEPGGLDPDERVLLVLLG